MLTSLHLWVLVVLLISALISLRSPRGETEKLFIAQSFSEDHHSVDDRYTESYPFFSEEKFVHQSQNLISEENPHPSNLEYDFYRATCPDAETIVRSTMSQIYAQHKEAPAQLLRLFFHDCFIQGCDASVLLDDSNGNRNYSIERQAIPNRTLMGFDKIDQIKEEVERVCPGIVSCADILSLASRDGIVLSGGPFFPVFTGRRDSTRSYYDEAMAEIPRPNDNITQTLRLFELRGFDERETVALLGGHNIGKIGCEFITKRMYNFSGTGLPDPAIAPDFLHVMRLTCGGEDNESKDGSDSSSSSPSTLGSRRMMSASMTYFQELSSFIISGGGFDTHYYRSLLMGRGLLFADQQLMANAKTSRLVRAYASDNGFTFRLDFARAMVKMSSLNVLTGDQGQVRLNCSLPAFSF